MGRVRMKPSFVLSVVLLVLASVVLVPLPAAAPKVPGDDIAAKLDAEYMKAVIEHYLDYLRTADIDAP